MHYVSIMSKMMTVRGLQFALALAFNNRDPHHLPGGHYCDIPPASMTETLLFAFANPAVDHGPRTRLNDAPRSRFSDAPRNRQPKRRRTVDPSEACLNAAAGRPCAQHPCPYQHGSNYSPASSTSSAPATNRRQPPVYQRPRY